METQYYWNISRPPDAKRLDVGRSETFHLAMERAFGELPVELSKDSIPKLEGMASMFFDISTNPFQQLILAVKRYGHIRVYPEYDSTEKSDG